MSLLYDTLPSIQRQIDDLFGTPTLLKYRPHNPLELDALHTQPTTSLSIEFPSPSYYSPPKCIVPQYLETDLFNDVPSRLNDIARQHLSDYVYLLKEATACASRLIHLETQNEKGCTPGSVKNLSLFVPFILKVEEANDFLKYSVNSINDQYKKDLSIAVLNSTKLELSSYLHSLKTEVAAEEFMKRSVRALNALEESMPQEEFQRLNVIVDSSFKPTFCQMIQHIQYLYQVYLKKCMVIFDENYPNPATIENAPTPLSASINSANYIQDELSPKNQNFNSSRTPVQRDTHARERIKHFLDDAVRYSQNADVNSSPPERYQSYHQYNPSRYRTQETQHRTYNHTQSYSNPRSRPHSNNYSHTQNHSHSHSHSQSYSHPNDSRFNNNNNYNHNKIRYPQSRNPPSNGGYRPYRPKPYYPSNPYPKRDPYYKY